MVREDPIVTCPKILPYPQSEDIWIKLKCHSFSSGSISIQAVSWGRLESPRLSLSTRTQLFWLMKTSCWTNRRLKTATMPLSQRSRHSCYERRPLPRWMVLSKVPLTTDLAMWSTIQRTWHMRNFFTGWGYGEKVFRSKPWGTSEWYWRTMQMGRRCRWRLINRGASKWKRRIGRSIHWLHCRTPSEPKRRLLLR